MIVSEAERLAVLPAEDPAVRGDLAVKRGVEKDLLDLIRPPLGRSPAGLDAPLLETPGYPAQGMPGQPVPGHLGRYWRVLRVPDVAVVPVDGIAEVKRPAVIPSLAPGLPGRICPPFAHALPLKLSEHCQDVPDQLAYRR